MGRIILILTFDNVDSVPTNFYQSNLVIQDTLLHKEIISDDACVLYRTCSVMAIVTPLSFSPNGEYFAYSSPDGTLKIWETVTGILKQEYTPSAHLSATCTCLSWGKIHNVAVR